MLSEKIGQLQAAKDSEKFKSFKSLPEKEMGYHMPTPLASTTMQSATNLQRHQSVLAPPMVSLFEEPQRVEPTTEFLKL